ncbi:MAG: flagellar basal body L-ring protein FlgH [Planctomycetota bacterium]
MLITRTSLLMSSVIAAAALGQDGTTTNVNATHYVPPSSSSSLLANQPLPEPDSSGEPVHKLEAQSMFFVAEPEPREFNKHDLIQIIVRENSTTKREHELETEKAFEIDGGIAAWPNFQLPDLLELQLEAGSSTNLPQVNLDFNKEFEGEGEYERKDSMTDRLTARVIEVRPNGNLVLEACTTIQTDEEISIMKVTGECRSDDVSPGNTIFSQQIWDLSIVRTHEGELKRTNEKGLIAKVLEAVFAF